MKKIRTTLVAALLVTATAATATATAAVFADDYRTQSFTDSYKIFTADGDAEVTGAFNGDNCYVYLKSGRDDSVTLRKNLAYYWLTSETDVNTFNMSMGFDSVNFESYTVKFQSQQYYKTKDGVTDNYLTFFPAEDNTKLKVALTDSDEVTVEDAADIAFAADAKLEISFKIPEDGFKGNYDLFINDTKIGQVENVFRNYAKYVSSGTSAATPLTLSAKYAESAAADVTTGVYVYGLNNQSLQLFDATKGDDGQYVSGGSFHDDQAPALCLDKNVNYLTYGSTIDVDYTVIDVIARSPRATVNYYVLKTADYNATDIDYEDATREGLFTEVSSSTTVKLLRDQYTYVPGLDADKGIVEIDGHKTYGLAKIYVEVKDTSSASIKQNIFIDWYTDGAYTYTDENLNGTNFIKIIEDNCGASYSYNAEGEIKDLDGYKARISEIEQAYQAKIDAAIEELEDKKLYAGSDSYFYLPDYEGYACDNFGGYTDLKYSVYYSASKTGSNTSLASNQLAINLTEANVTYRFTVYVTDAAGNRMYYYDKDGKMQTISTDDIWDEEYADLLPFFTFDVSYKAATVEDPGEQTIGYVGTTYSSASFEIKGVSDTYSAEYKLYVFDRDRYFTDNGSKNEYLITYEDFVKRAEELFNDADTRAKYFTNIRAKSDLHEEDEDYEYQVEYAWNSGSVTFVPQSANEFYLIRLELTDTGMSNQKTEKYMAIRASAKATEIKGESDWLENNVASVVLYCVSGVLLIAVVLLLVIKPKDKGDIDKIELDKPSGKKNKKS